MHVGDFHALLILASQRNSEEEHTHKYPSFSPPFECIYCSEQVCTNASLTITKLHVVYGFSAFFAVRFIADKSVTTNLVLSGVVWLVLDSVFFKKVSGKWKEVGRTHPEELSFFLDFLYFLRFCFSGFLINIDIWWKVSRKPVCLGVIPISTTFLSKFV